LTVTTPGQEVIGVDTGTYDVANGETFPLIIPAGVALQPTVAFGIRDSVEIGGAIDLPNASSSLEGITADGLICVEGGGDSVMDTTVDGVGATCLALTGAAAAEPARLQRRR
jgi:Protein of unknown function (DUF1565)